MLLSIIISILIGAFIGWLAGVIMKSKHGFWMNCLLGIIGGAVGSGLSGVLGVKGGLVVSTAMGVVGTIIVIAIVRLIMGKKW